MARTSWTLCSSEMWPELEKRLDAVPKTGAAVAPLRSEREMVAELLELSRGAAANVAWSKEALTTLLKRTNGFTAQSGLTGEVGRFDLRTTLSDRIEAGERALAESKAALAGFETGTRPLPTYDELKQRVRELEERGKRKRTMRSDAAG